MDDTEVFVELAIKTRSKVEVFEKPVQSVCDKDGTFVTTKYVYYHAKDSAASELTDTEDSP